MAGRGQAYLLFFMAGESSLFRYPIKRLSVSAHNRRSGKNRHNRYHPVWDDSRIQWQILHTVDGIHSLPADIAHLRLGNVCRAVCRRARHLSIFVDYYNKYITPPEGYGSVGE
ncbi:hypothetical protein ACGVWS_06990 [Enterobacteriaceae bacterium LUAb1]